MKIVAFIFCLMLSANAFGQQKSTRQQKPAPLYVVDGVIVEKGAWLGNLNPADIKTINVLKGKAATDLYGAKAANGVIIVFTKNSKRQPLNFALLQHNLAIASPSAKPLVVLDGAIFKGDIGTIDSNKVKGVEFLPALSATMIYGAAAANGVINIKMKPQALTDTVKNN